MRLAIIKNIDDEVMEYDFKNDLFVKDDIVRVDDDEWNQVAKDNAYDEGTLDDYASDVVDEDVRTITFEEALEHDLITLPQIILTEEEDIRPIYDLLYAKVPIDYQTPFDDFKKQLLQKEIYVIDGE